MKTPKFYPIRIVLLLTFTLIISCKEQKDQQAEEEPIVQYKESKSLLPINKLKLPEGFKIEVFADSIDGARSMAMGENGTLFVGTRNEGTVYAI